MNEAIEAEIVAPTTAVAVRPQYQAPAYMTEAERKATIADTLNKVALVMEIMDQAMKDGEHYGTIPGCGEKKALLKPGAEKLGLTFRLKPQFEIKRTDHPHQHREYEIKCTLSDGTQGVGTCSTLEAKYRFRSGERKCPKCSKATIIKGKAEYGGGWLCFAKKGGCGAKFADDDKTITGQNVDRVEHDNPADFWNTCLKMGKKRAHVDAIITATACSDIFTQDVEEAVEAANEAQQEFPKTKQQHAPAQGRAAVVSPTPQPGEGGSPTHSPGLPFKSVDELLKVSKTKFLTELAKSTFLFPAWAWAKDVAHILPNEKLEAITLTKLFPSVDQRGDYDAAIKAIKKDYDGLMTEVKRCADQLKKDPNLWASEHRAFEAVYGPKGASTAEPEQPATAKRRHDAAVASTEASQLEGRPINPEWFWDVIISIPRKGQKKAEYEKNPDTIGSLYDALKNGDDYARSRLFGLANDWDCKPREYNGRTYPPSEGDKATRKGLDAFLEWEAAKAKEGAKDMREEVEQEPDDLDDVPF